MVTFTKKLLEHLASFRKETDEEDLFFRVGLLEGTYWLALEDKDNLQAKDELVRLHKDNIGNIWIYCDRDDLAILKKTKVAYEYYGLSKKVCYKELGSSQVYFSGELHPKFRSW